MDSQETSNDSSRSTPQSAFRFPSLSFFRRKSSRSDANGEVGPLLGHADLTTDFSTSTPDGNRDSDVHGRQTKTKLSALDRLKRFGVKKAKKDEVEFPPASWGLNAKSGQPVSMFAGANNEEVAKAAAVPLPPTPVPVALEGNGEVEREEHEQSQNSKDGVVDLKEQPEPTSLAARIQSLMSSMPLWSYSSSSGSNSPVPQAETNEELSKQFTEMMKDGKLPPPPLWSKLISDSALETLLTSRSVMNGSISKGRESVWAVLDRLRIFSSRSGTITAASSCSAPGDEQQKNALLSDMKEVVEEDVEVEGSADVMLYAPLEPTADSEIEVARSEIVTEDDDEDSYASTATTGAIDAKVGAEPKSVPSTLKAADKGKDKLPAPKQKKEKVLWLPSPTKISVQATWWGYRIFLPPAVLAVLGNAQMEVAKRAALLTTALKWLLDHLPLALLPPQLRPAAHVLRRLVPVLGYIGAFVAWSWGAVKTFDRGNGVVLSATWLLPVFPIPGTWDLNDFPIVPPPVPPPKDR